MQSGIDSSRTRIDGHLGDGATRIDIHPDAANNAGGARDFFGPDGLSFRDVLDAINPLNHIPIVADIMKAQTGHEVSTVSKLAGGTLFGGPIGFVASLASVIFEEATGESPVAAAYAALSGDQTTQVASNASIGNAATASDLREDVTIAAAAPVDGVEQRASLASAAPQANPKPETDAVLALYGNSNASAHRSYEKAQLLPYLQDVNKSQVL